mgnify:CR=1 FL=1
MNWIVTQIKWIMLVSGVLTCSMLLAALAPQVALQNMFGDSIQGPIAEIVVRNWGALIALGGGMLIYGAYNVASRSLVLVVAVVSKLVFITLVLSFGSQYLGQQVVVAVVGGWIVPVIRRSAVPGGWRPVLFSIPVGLVCWALPVYQELTTDPGNLTLLARSGGEPGGRGGLMAVKATRPTESIPMLRLFAPRSTSEVLTDAAYKRGGRSPTRTSSGDTTSGGTNGRKLAPTPTIVSSRGADTSRRRASSVTVSTVATNATTAMARVTGPILQKLGYAARSAAGVSLGCPGPRHATCRG